MLTINVLQKDTFIYNKFEKANSSQNQQVELLNQEFVVDQEFVTFC